MKALIYNNIGNEPLLNLLFELIHYHHLKEKEQCRKALSGKGAVHHR